MQTAEEKKGDTEFSSAFDEAANKSDKTPDDKPPEVDAGSDTPATTEDENKYAALDGRNLDGMSDEQKDSVLELVTSNQKLAHQINSDDGRVRAYQSKVTELETALTNNREKAEVEGKPDDTPSTEDIAAAMKDEDSWAEFTEDYPDIASAIDARLKKSEDAVNTRVDERIAPVVATAEESAVAEGYTYLDTEYEGWRGRVATQEYQEWIATQNDDVKRWAASDNVKDAESLIQNFDNYLIASGKMADLKKDGGEQPPEDESEADALERKRQEQLEDGATPIGSGRAGVDVGGDNVPGSFSSAFNAYAQKKERERKQA